MSNNRGIFETFSNQPSESDRPANPPQSSPFAMATDQPSQNGNPAPEATQNSPFSIVDENKPNEADATVRLPEPRKANESPFQVAEPQGFGFEAPPQARVSPLEQNHPAQAPQQPSPVPSSPFSVAQPEPTQNPEPAQNPFGGWPQTNTAPVASQPSPVQQTAMPASAGNMQQSSMGDSSSDSSSIKQLELRAIFGVDREMTKDEILQRARSLPGVRHIAKVSQNDISTVDSLKQVIANLGFGGGAIKLYAGSVPIEFIREGETLLAVQTDGGFAPGVRETLMIVAREIGS
ncbi:MAG: hypothetical protein AB8D78_15380 [Akkermansiaceae bacterium]